MMRKMKNKKNVWFIVIILIILSLLLTFLTKEKSQNITNFLVSFIGILSGLFGIFSIFINFAVLNSISDLESNKVIEQIKNDLFYKDNISRVRASIKNLKDKTITEDFLTDDVLKDLTELISFCELEQTKNSYNNIIQNNIEVESENIGQFFQNIVNLRERDKIGRVYSVDVIPVSNILKFKTSLTHIGDFMDSYDSIHIEKAIRKEI